MNNQKKRLMILAGVVIMLVLLAIPMISLQSSNRKLKSLLDLGEKYLEDLQYESALVVFDEAIAIEPKCAEAYLGKAKAQYAMQLYQDAIDTLYIGIEMVDDSTELEAFLRQILDELSAGTTEKQERQEIEETYAPIVLNYRSIVRSTETENPVIQLEVLGGGDETYIWESSNTECATVSDTGLVTCLPTEGYACITVTAADRINDEDYDYRNHQCDIVIYDSQASWRSGESEQLRIVLEDTDKNQEQYMIVDILETENNQISKIIKDVYFSGDVEIPEQFAYKNEMVSITNISSDAFYWSYEMRSIFIPAFVRSVNEYYLRNPFGYCLALEEIKVDERNEFFKVVDGVLYSKDGKQLISYPVAKRGSTYTLPKEVEKVYEEAFVGCRNLEEILVEDGNQYYESVDGVLMDKAANRLIAYPIGNKSASYTVPENITNMADGAFYMSNLEEVICKSVENIYSDQFAECNKLKKIEGGVGTKRIYMPVYDEKDNAEWKLAGLDEMVNLEQLVIDISKIQDLMLLLELQNLTSVSIYSQEDVADGNLKKQLETLEEQKPETSFSIYNY